MIAGIEVELKEAEMRLEAVWCMARVYLSQRDSHGLMDMGAELQAIERTIKALERAREFVAE